MLAQGCAAAACILAVALLHLTALAAAAVAREEQRVLGVAHMVNDARVIEWALAQGAGALEADLNFDGATGEPTVFTHGGLCDCTVLCPLRALCPAASVCSALWDASGARPCGASTPAAELLEAVAAQRERVQLLYVDSKVQGAAPALQAAAGKHLVAALASRLFARGYAGSVLRVPLALWAQPRQGGTPVQPQGLLGEGR
eukprot:m51a1_g6085 putative sphingomyelin phosphodiesterase d (201) ;mRNA; f:13935-18042